jgi:hypothetical protein
MPAKGFHGAQYSQQGCLPAVLGDALCTRRKITRGSLPKMVSVIVRMLRPAWPEDSALQARLHNFTKVIDFRVMTMKGPSL